MKNLFILMAGISVLTTSCNETTASTNNDGNTEPAAVVVKTEKTKFPNAIKIDGIAQNPEGVEFNKEDNTFLLSSLNAGPIIKVNLDGTFKPFTSGEKFPVSTAGLQIDYKHNRLLVAGFNGTELYDQDPATKGASFLRVYNLKTGVIEQDVNLSSLAPDAMAYFANDIAVDTEGNSYVSDWYAGVVYKVDLEGNSSIFWRNETGIPSGPNGLDFHSDGYLLVSILNVNGKGLYADFGLVKIPVKDSKLAKVVTISDSGFTGFDGMVINAEGNVVGVTNNGTTPGGNTLLELASTNNWESAEIVHTKAISASTTVAITPTNINYVINQDFMSGSAETWTIEQIKF
jgi:sugar lactone lactonase YvrE